MNCKPTSVVPAFLTLTPQHLLHERVDTFGNRTAVQGIKWIYMLYYITTRQALFHGAVQTLL